MEEFLTSFIERLSMVRHYRESIFGLMEVGVDLDKMEPCGNLETSLLGILRMKDKAGILSTIQTSRHMR